MDSGDVIVIEDLEVAYRVGVPDPERQQPQRLLLSVRMSRNLREAARTDDVSRTIDYYAVTQRLLRLGEGRSWKLIETVAEEVAHLVAAEFGASAVSVEVKKFIIPQARYVAVRITR